MGTYKCHSVNVYGVVVLLGGGGDTATLHAVMELCGGGDQKALKVVGTSKCHFMLYECTWNGGSTHMWWGHLNTANGVNGTTGEKVGAKALVRSICKWLKHLNTANGVKAGTEDPRATWFRHLPHHHLFPFGHALGWVDLADSDLVGYCPQDLGLQGAYRHYLDPRYVSSRI